MLRFLTAGESHGPALVVTVEGMPAGLPILVDDIASELARRRLGYGRGPRMRFEQDELELLGGIRHGRTLGSPIAIVIRNSEWATGKWNERCRPRRRHREAADAAAAGARRPRRHAEVRVHRCATCSSAPAHARSPRASRPVRSRRCCCARSTCRCSATWCSWAARSRCPSAGRGPATSNRSTARKCGAAIPRQKRR